MTQLITYSVNEVIPYINWIYFFNAWDMDGERQESEQGKQLFEAAGFLLKQFERYRTFALCRLCDAYSCGDDLLLDGTLFPMLRQQKVSRNEPNLCLSDFVPPLTSQKKEKVGVFATTVDKEMEKLYPNDFYNRMLAQTLADRLAEATAEKLHEEVRKTLWGYVPNENLSMHDLHLEKFQGIRPAVGYPSLPDISVNFIINELLDLSQINISLSENGMMQPHASVSGLMFSHPQSRYFAVGKISYEQFVDYASRRNIPQDKLKKFLASNLL